MDQFETEDAENAMTLFNTRPEKVEISFATPLRIVLQPAPEEPYHAIFKWQIDNLTFQGENMSNTMQSGTLATVSVAWKDTAGNPAKVDGPTTWNSTDPTIVTVTTSTGNPLIANLKSLGPIGKVQIHANADADMGAGVRPVTSTVDVEVIGGEATGGEITFTQSPPQQKPPAGTPMRGR